MDCQSIHSATRFWSSLSRAMSASTAAQSIFHLRLVLAPSAWSGPPQSMTPAGRPGGECHQRCETYTVTSPAPGSCGSSQPLRKASARHVLVDFQILPCSLNLANGITSIGVDSSKSAASDAWAAPLSIFASRFHRMANSRNSTPPPPPSSALPLALMSMFLKSAFACTIVIFVPLGDGRVIIRTISASEMQPSPFESKRSKAALHTSSAVASWRLIRSVRDSVMLARCCGFFDNDAALRPTAR